MSTSDTALSLPNLSREEFWRCHINQWHDSGLSRMAYCHQQSLIYHQMVYWVRKFSQVPDDTSMVAPQSKSKAFVPIEIAERTTTNGLSLVLPSGVEIHGITSASVCCVGDLLTHL